MRQPNRLAEDCHRLDLQEELGAGETGHNEQRVCRRVPASEVLTPDLSECGDILEIGHVGGRLDHVGERSTDALHCPVQVSKYQFCLRLEVTAAHHLSRAVESDLSRDVHCAAIRRHDDVGVSIGLHQPVWVDESGSLRLGLSRMMGAKDQRPNNCSNTRKAA
jgi:hypothetical protein